jgi:CheY-like chemotaxis protein
MSQDLSHESSFSSLTLSDLHDAKNLVISIKSSLELLPVDNSVQSVKIMASLDFASSLLLDILNKRLLASGSLWERASCSALSLISSATMSLTGAADVKGIDINVFFDVPTFSLIADCRGITRALFNVLDNAIKRSTDGPIVVSLAFSALRWAEGAEAMLICSVADRGPGLSPSEKSTLALGDVPIDSVSIELGNGIGLKSVQKWAQMSGGELIVGNRLDAGGALFQLRIPIELGAAFTPPLVDFMTDIILMSDDLGLSRDVSTKLPNDSYRGSSQEFFKSPNDYFNAEGRLGAVRVLLVDGDTELGMKFRQGGALRAPFRNTICVVIKRSFSLSSQEDYAAEGFNAALSIHDISTTLPSLIAEHAKYVHIATTRGIRGLRHSDVMIGKRVLIADDNRDNLLFCEALLSHAGAECTTAKDGQEATQFLNAALPGHYDFILLDYYLPFVRGDQILIECSAQLTNSRVVIMSADDIDKSILGENFRTIPGIIKKPLSAEMLFNVLFRDETVQTDCAFVNKIHRADKALLDLANEMKLIFVQGIGKELLHIYDCVIAHDYQMIQSRIHKLKGSAHQHGFTRLGKLCEYSAQKTLGFASITDWFSALSIEIDDIVLKKGAHVGTTYTMPLLMNKTLN